MLVSENRDEYNNIHRAELVISVDLVRSWPEDCLLKLRIDFFNLLSDNTPVRVASPKIIYYSASDMDEIDHKNHSYRKKVVIAVGKKLYHKHEIVAYFIYRKAK